jgi:dolichol-phosphate mannosyltransferase
MLYIVLPVYNEEKHIARVIRDLRRLLDGMPYRIVVVNDGSSDRSLEILKKLKNNDLHIESYRVNMNVGTVFTTGIEYVLSHANDNDVMIIMESDNTSSTVVIKQLIHEISKGNEIAIASRYLPGGGYRNFPFIRRMFSYFASLLLHYYFPIRRVFDYTIFFRAYRVGILKKTAQYFGRYGLIQSLGFVANAELLVKLSFFTDRIVEVPFLYDYGKKSGASKIHVLKTINEYFTVISYLQRCRESVRRY